MSILSEEKGVEPGPFFFRLAPKFRRCGIYLFIGYLFFAGIVIGLEQLGLTNRGWDQVILLLALFAVPMLGIALFLYRQLLRVDDRGIWRRRFFRWDLWPWETFTAGQVHQGSDKDSFVLRSKPWWNRYLFLAVLQDEEREHLVNRIREVWTPPPLPILPAELTIRWGLGYWADLSEKGIVYGKGKSDFGCFFPWTAVLCVRITRLEHGRRDFRAVEIVLPEVDRPILLHFHEGRPRWTGADAETLGAFLERAVPPDRVLLTAMMGPPRTVAEADWRLLDVKRMERETKQLAWITGPLMLASIVFLLLVVILRVDEPNSPPWDIFRTIGAAVMCLLCGLGVAPTCYVLLRRTEQANTERAELIAWREDLKRRGIAMG